MFALYKVLILIGMSVLSQLVNAGVVVNGTRVIYNEGSREVEVHLENTDKSPFLLQNWIDDGQIDAMPADISVPFMLSPPISRIEAEGGQVLRVFYTGGELPQDVESVFWLNVLAAPSISKDLDENNFLQVAFRTRIKLFFRPKSLKDVSVLKSQDEISVYKHKDGIRVKNSSPFHISISKLSIEIDGKEYASKSNMVSPKGVSDFFFQNIKSEIVKGSLVKISYINDYGGVSILERTIK